MKLAGGFVVSAVLVVAAGAHSVTDPAVARHMTASDVDTIHVSASADPTSVREPGGLVAFSVTITNSSSVQITVDNVVEIGRAHV